MSEEAHLSYDGMRIDTANTRGLPLLVCHIHDQGAFCNNIQGIRSIALTINCLQTNRFLDFQITEKVNRPDARTKLRLKPIPETSGPAVSSDVGGVEQLILTPS